MKFRFTEFYSNPYFSLEEGLTDEKEGITDPYYRIVTGDSVICCVLDKELNFIMVEQFRPNLDKTTLEFPAGGVKPKELPMEAAKREFKEETGMTSDFLYLGSFHLMMNRVNSNEHVFFGFDPKVSENTNAELGIRERKILRADLKKLIEKGKFKQIAGLGVIQMASMILGLDILNSNVEEISNEFSSRMS